MDADFSPDLGSVLMIVSVPDRTAKRLLDTSARHGGARFSPDGKWVAYSSEETGRFEVFVLLKEVARVKLLHTQEGFRVQGLIPPLRIAHRRVKMAIHDRDHLGHYSMAPATELLSKEPTNLQS